jgi:hypothetical protein
MVQRRLEFRGGISLLWYAVCAGPNVDNWFASISSDGFVVMPGPVPADRLAEFSRRYDETVAKASPDDIKEGSTTTRVSGLDRHAAFDELYLYPQILQACCRILEQPFQLSTMHARTLRPRTPAQRLHVDFAGDAQGWPMVGFILMIDDFTPENGATCFVRGSQGTQSLPAEPILVPACGPAGSVIVYNGSVWHGHGPNYTGAPRRSIQGAYIRRTEAPAI